jgi:molecular chaperone Hsp33
MQDTIYRGMDIEGNIRFVAGDTTNLVKEGEKRHLLKFPGNKVLGELLTATALLSTFLKNNKDTITVNIKGGGALGGLVAISDVHLFVRGYAENPSYVSPLAFGGEYDPKVVVGTNGYLRIITDQGLKYPYIGSVELETGEVEKELTHYLINSEQTSSMVCLSVVLDHKGEVEKAGGIILQLMPNSDPVRIEEFKNLVLKQDLVRSSVENEGSLKNLLENIFEGIEVKILNKRTCQFHCHCSRDKMFRALLTLGKKDLETLFEENEEVETRCHYCNEYYHFKKDEFDPVL